MEPLFLSPFFLPKIWGGRKLETVFDYSIPEGKIGECWAISAHPHGLSKIKNGALAGMPLNEVYQKYPDYFGNPIEKVFPLLTKILDANDSLSVQVHPDNEYAAVHEHELGKTECWYVIQADPGSYLIYGHHAQTKEELVKMIENGDWEHLLRKYPVKTGDFVFVPSGTIHALNKGIMVLETQQSSDTTYRLYDYNRVDEKTGEKRKLHLKQSIDVTTVPSVDPKLDIETEKRGKSTFTTYVKPPISPHFCVWQWQIKDRQELTHQQAAYTLLSVIDGQGTLITNQKSYPLKKGDHLIMPAGIKNWELNGNLQIIASEPSSE